MITLVTTSNRYTIPESYNELSGKQFIRIAHLFAKQLEYEEARYVMLRILLGLSAIRYGMISLYDKLGMSEHIEWAFEKNGITQQLLPSYRRNIFCKRFVGPAGEFDNLTLGEFHYAERVYRSFVEEEDISYLDYLVAILYRLPKEKYDYQLNKDGDARIAFNRNESAFYAKKIAKWRIGVKLAILMWYDGCRQMLVEQYEPVFSGGGEDNEDGMFGIIRGISGPVYGTIEEVEHLNIHTALAEICKQINEAKEVSTTT